jgi:hypothetical protein
MKVTHLAWMAVAAMLLLAPMAMAADHGGKGKAKGTTVVGEIKSVDVDKGTITITVKGKEKGATEEKTLAVTTATTVKIEKAPAAEGEKPKTEDGKLTDLVAGQRVVVKCTEDGKTALEILVLVKGAHKGGDKGGGHKGGAPK